MSAAIGIFLGIQDRVRNSRGRRAIGVRAIEVLLYFSLYRAVSQRREERTLMMGERKKKYPKNPTRTYCKPSRTLPTLTSQPARTFFSDENEVVIPLYSRVDSALLYSN